MPGRGTAFSVYFLMVSHYEKSAAQGSYSSERNWRCLGLAPGAFPLFDDCSSLNHIPVFENARRANGLGEKFRPARRAKKFCAAR
jgi:hypothetical protein